MLYLTAKGGIHLLSMRQKTIVRYILGHPSGVAGHQLSELLRVSGKTIRNDISEINRWLKEYKIRICASQKEGYFIPDVYRNQIIGLLEDQADPDTKWEIQTPQERRLAIMGRILGRPGIRLDQIAERLCVSEQTLYKDFVRLRTMLYEICDFKELVIRSHCLYIEATEYEILRLIFRLIASCIMSSSQMMDGLLLHWMRGIVNLSEIYTFYGYTVKYCREKKMKVSDSVLYISAWLIFYINMRREEAHFLEKEERILPEDDLSGFLRYMDQSLFLELDICDFSFLYDFLRAVGFPAGRKEEKEEALELARRFGERLWEQNQILLTEHDERKELFDAFISDLQGLILRIKLEAQIFDLTPREEEDTRRGAFGAILLLHPLIKEQYGRDVTPAELRHLSGYVEAVCPIVRPPVRIQMIVGADSGFFYSICRWIREHFSDNVKLCGSCPRYLLETSLEENKPDLLLAAAPINIQSQIPQITLSAPFSEDEGKRLCGFIEELSRKKQTEFVISRFLHEDQVIFLDGEPSFEEMAQALCRNLEETGCIRDWKRRFTELSEKENWYKSPVMNGFCFLRPMSKTDQKDGISVAVASGKKAALKVMMIAAFVPGRFSKQEALYGFLRKLWKAPSLAERLQKEETGAAVLKLMSQFI